MSKLLVTALIAAFAAPAAMASTPANVAISPITTVATSKAPANDTGMVLEARRGRGADDAPGDDRGRRRGGNGADDTAGNPAPSIIFEARRGRGRGADDAPNHG